jgi:hypothetical protein
MQDIIRKLLKHLKWRLSPAGKKFKPKRGEIDSWAPQRIPPSVPFLLWLAYFFICVFSLVDGFDPFSSPLAFFTVGPGGWLLAGLGLRLLGRSLNQGFLLGAYRNLLQSNERFALVEYTRYLERQIARAKADPALGGAAEVERLLGVYGEMKQLLREGAGKQGGGPLASALAEDAELGEALVQTYGELKVDPLQELDSRLPPALLDRLKELDLEETEHAAEPQREAN